MQSTWPLNYRAGGNSNRKWIENVQVAEILLQSQKKPSQNVRKVYKKRLSSHSQNPNADTEYDEFHDRVKWIGD